MCIRDRVYDAQVNPGQQAPVTAAPQSETPVQPELPVQARNTQEQEGDDHADA